jgi:hypothetical protein
MQPANRQVAGVIPRRTGSARVKSAWSLTGLDVGRLAFVIGMVTASFDIFLVMSAGGFTLRPYQVLLPVMLAYALGQAFSVKKIRVPLGIVPLVIWVLFILAFVPNTPVLLRSVGYAAWLIMDVMVIVAAVQLFDDEKWARFLLRWYLTAFLFVSSFGLLQLVLGVAHLRAPFVRQWLIYGWFPRINGFSYEPSYFASYLIMGWVLSAWLVEQRSDLLPQKFLRLTFGVSTAALIVATSRLGWAMMMVWAAGFALRRLRRLAPVHFSLTGWFITINLALLLTATVGAMAFHKADRLLGMFAGGTGLFGTASHSVDQRQSQFDETVKLVKKSPFIGYSLGGIAPAIGEGQWERVKGQEGAKGHEGMSVFAEVLAASGVIGFIPFVLYMIILLVAPWLLSRKCDSAYRPVLTGLLWGFIMELIVLQFNQNILRAYLWFHIAVLSAIYAVVKDQLPRRRVYKMASRA